MTPAINHNNICLIAGEITPMRPVKRFKLLREINYSAALNDKMVKNYSSADGRKTQAHESPCGRPCSTLSLIASSRDAAFFEAWLPLLNGIQDGIQLG